MQDESSEKRGDCAPQTCQSASIPLNSWTKRASIRAKRAPIRTKRAPWRLIHTRIRTISPPPAPTSANETPSRPTAEPQGPLDFETAEPPLAARAETIFGHKSHWPLAAAANIEPRPPAKTMIGERMAREFHSQSLSRSWPEKATKRPRAASILRNGKIATKLGAPRRTKAEILQSSRKHGYT